MADSIEEGVYEIRPSYAYKTLALDAVGQGTANGTNVGVWEILNQNNQRWKIYKDTAGGWRIKCVHSGLFLAAHEAKIEKGTNVNTWEWSDYLDGISQRWNIVPTGNTVNIDGKVCMMVWIYGGNGTTYPLDKEGGVNDTNTNVELWEYLADHANQIWVLYPSYRVGTSVLPSPTWMYPAKVPGWSARDGKTDPREQGKYYLRLTGGTNGLSDLHLDLMSRYRTYKNGTWGSWSTWTNWTEYSVKWQHPLTYWSNTCYTSKAFDFSLEPSTGAAIQYSFSARTRSGEYASLSYSQSFKFYYYPIINITSATYTLEGMRIGMSNSYSNYGTTTYKISSLTGVNTSSLGTLTDSDGYLLIPYSAITSIPKDGATITMKWQSSICDGIYTTTRTGSATFTYDGGTVDVTPTITEGTGATLIATVNYANNVRMWIVNGNEKTELTGTVSNGKTIFQVAYPFGTTYQLFTWYESTSSTDWGCDVTTLSSEDVRIHAWDWDGGAFAMWLDTEYVKESRDYQLETSTHTLAGRSKPVVSRLTDSNGDNYLSVSGSVSGVLLDDDKYNCTLDDFEALLKAGYARYRSPYGRIVNVVVTGGSVEKNYWMSTISIDQTEVSS